MNLRCRFYSLPSRQHNGGLRLFLAQIPTIYLSGQVMARAAVGCLSRTIHPLRQSLIVTVYFVLFWKVRVRNEQNHRTLVLAGRVSYQQINTQLTALSDMKILSGGKGQ